jgi:hypothetical protein
MRIREHRLKGSGQIEAFTLIEAMVASGLVLIVFVALYAGVSFCFSVTDFERQNLRATQVMLERVEGLRLLNWFQLTNTALNPATFTQQYYPAVGSTPASGVMYTGTVTVTGVNLVPAASYSNNVKQVTVTLTWKSGSVIRNRSLTTYASRNGIQNYIYSN